MKHIVGFSGGIDSQHCANVVIDIFGPDDVILLNSQAGRNEHWITKEHVKWYSENVHPVIEVVPLMRDLQGTGTKDGFAAKDRRCQLNEASEAPLFAGDEELTFNRLAFIKGRFPSKTQQFCTEFLKLRPQKRWAEENLHAQGIDYERYTGIRRDESRDRATIPDRWWDEFFDCYVNAPIASLTKQSCFEAVKARGQKINPLYLMGFSRVGCAPCINETKAGIREWNARFPEVVDKIREWEKEVGATFFAPHIPDGTGKRIVGSIDEVIAWSKTELGGKQYSLPFIEAEAARGACISKYGLCE